MSIVCCGACHKSALPTDEQKTPEGNHQGGLLPVSSPKIVRLKSEFDFLKDLQTNGQLPGVPNNMKGFFGADAEIYTTPGGGSTQEVVFRTHNKPEQDFHYLVGRPSSNSAWHIDKAWHFDPSTKATHEYPVR